MYCLTNNVPFCHFDKVIILNWTKRNTETLKLVFFLSCASMKGLGITPKCHCVKSARIRNYSGPHFPAFGLNADSRILLSLRIQFECRKMRTRITPNTNTFHTVYTAIQLFKRILECLHKKTKHEEAGYEIKYLDVKLKRKCFFLPHLQ